MRSIFSRRLGSLVLGSVALGLPLACGAAKSGDLDGRSNRDGFFSDDGPTGSLRSAQSFLAFPGGGSSGAAQPLTAALAPETSDDCNPQPSPSATGTDAVVQTVCFFSDEDADVPAATIEQIVEVVGTAEWVHLRLTLNPDFVDNTYGQTAIGWGEDGGAGAAPPPPRERPERPTADAPPPPREPRGDAPPPRGDAPPPPAAGGPGADADGPAGGARPGPQKKGGHTFRDLTGSDHAEIELLDAQGQLSVHFRLDYVSASESAASGFASLGVTAGEGRLIVGEPEWILATATSIDRNLNACGLGSFVEDSPATDELYTPNPDATAWDFRVAYEVWVSTEAFGSAGFGSALIENVHASPSKNPGDTVNVLPAPCPVDPANPDAVPQPVPAVLQTIR